MTPPLVGIVVPVRNRREKTLRFLESLAAQSWPNALPIIVDSNSSDGTPAAVAKAFPKARVVTATDADFWTGATNRGVKAALAAGCEYILTVNDDSIFGPDIVSDLVGLARTFDFPILGCRIDYLSRPGMIWSIGASHNWATRELFALNYHNVREEHLPEIIRDALAVPVESTPGNGVLIHRRVFEHVGLYDENNTPHYHADTEFLLRCRMRGFTPRVSPKIIVYNDADPDDDRRAVEDIPWIYMLRGARPVIASMYWMLTNRKSHYFLPAHAYVVRRYCPWGQRWRSMATYLAGVASVALNGDPGGSVSALFNHSSRCLRRTRLARTVGIIGQQRHDSMRKRNR